MQAASDVANRALMSSGETQRSRSSDDGRVPQKIVDRVFMRLQAIYRQKWSSQFTRADGQGDAAYRVVSAEWAKTLAGLSLDEIGQGLERMKDTPRFDEWPPNPMQFRRLCKPERQPYERKEFQGNALPAATTADRASSFRHIERIREQLRGSHAN